MAFLVNIYLCLFSEGGSAGEYNASDAEAALELKHAAVHLVRLHQSVLHPLHQGGQVS